MWTDASFGESQLSFFITRPLLDAALLRLVTLRSRADATVDNPESSEHGQPVIHRPELSYLFLTLGLI